MALTGCWWQAATFAPGSVRLILTRWLLFAAAGLPGALAGGAALMQGPAAEPYFADAPQPLPVTQFVELLGRTPGGMWGLLFVGVAAAWLFSQLLTAAAASIFLEPEAGKPRVWRAIFSTGPKYFGRYLRVAVCAGIWLAIAIVVTNGAVGWLADRGALAGWSAQTAVTMRVIQALVLLVVAGAVGTCALWCRVAVVASNRRCVRRLHQVVVGVSARAPIQGLLLQVLVASLVLIAGAAAVVGWRQAGAGHTQAWLAVWLTVLLVQAYVWHWRIRLCCELARSGIAATWTAVPDEPWRIPRRLWRGGKSLISRVRKSESSPKLLLRRRHERASHRDED